MEAVLTFSWTISYWPATLFKIVLVFSEFPEFCDLLPLHQPDGLCCWHNNTYEEIIRNHEQKMNKSNSTYKLSTGQIPPI